MGGGLVQKLQSELKKTSWLKVQFMIFLFALHVYQDVRRCCQKTFESFVSNRETPNGACSGRKSNEEPKDSGLYKLPMLLRLYSFYSNCYLSFIILKNVLPLGEWVQQVFGIATHLPSHCIFPGQFTLYPHSRFYKVISTPIAALYMSWRLSHVLMVQDYQLNLVMFLSQEVKHLVPLYARLQLAGDEHSLTDYQKFLRHVLCYKIKHNNSTVVYRLRPHRTLEARDMIISHLTTLTLKTLACFSVLASVAFPYSWVIGLPEGFYLIRYPNCQPEHSVWFKEGKTSFWSIIPFASWHRFYASVMDTFENVCLYLDSGLALTFCIALGFIINYDIVYYCRCLREKLVKLDLVLKRRHYLSEQQRKTLTHFYEQQEEVIGNKSGEEMEIILDRLEVDTKQAQYERKIYEIQAEINDFFHQLESADSIESDVVTVGFILWFSTFGVSIYFNVRESLVSRWIIMVPFLGVALVTFVVFNLLTIHQEVQKTYPLMCSIMAHSGSSRHRLKFLQLIEFYTKRKKGTFTIMHSIPFSKATYFEMIGWTFSFMAITAQLLQEGN